MSSTTAAALAVASSLVIAILVLAIAPRGFAADASTDEVARYAPVAQRLLAGGSLVDGTGPRAVWYPPGYPVLLAGVLWVSAQTGIPSRTVLTAAGVAGMCATTLFVFLIGRRVWSVRGGLSAALVWATYPLALYFLKQPTSEIPFLVAMLAALSCVACVVHGIEPPFPRVVLCGVLLGVAMLIRPIGIGLGFLLASLIVLAGLRRSAALALTLLAANAATVAPWEMLVYSKTGLFLPLSANGPASVLDGLTFAAASKGFRQGTWVPSGAREVMERFNDRPYRPFTMRTVGGAVADEFVADPIGVLQLLAAKAARSWYATDSQRFEGVLLVLQTAYLALIGWATRRAWRAGGFGRRVAIAAWTIAVYFWTMSIVGLSIARYMVPAMSVLFVVLPAVRSWRGDAVQRDARTPTAQPVAS